MTMTKEQEDRYEQLLALGWEFDYTDADGVIHMRHVARQGDYSILLGTISMPPDGKLKYSF